jgi:hypothetical protein
MLPARVHYFRWRPPPLLPLLCKLHVKRVRAAAHTMLPPRRHVTHLLILRLGAQPVYSHLGDMSRDAWRDFMAGMLSSCVEWFSRRLSEMTIGRNVAIRKQTGNCILEEQLSPAEDERRPETYSQVTRHTSHDTRHLHVLGSVAA